MKRNIKLLGLITALVCLTSISVYGTEKASQNNRWIRPDQNQGESTWGFKDGIRVGLNPSSIRGLIMIYTPYLGHRNTDVINFFAIEPIVEGEQNRGFSELEYSSLDKVQGKRIWSADRDLDYSVKEASKAAQGVIGSENGIETLSVYLFVEPFENGAKVYVCAKFYANNPYEVEISTYQCPDSKKLSNCIVTATMGNYARLRQLYLRDEIITSKQIWPLYSEHNFAPHHFIEKNQMIHSKTGLPYLLATPDEKNPAKAYYLEQTPVWWKYYGKKATQYWYCKTPKETLQGLVNGRIVYWGGDFPIPEGIAFENFELKQPFSQGDKFVFGISPLPAKKIIKQIQ